jgi:hypothetical protein
MGVYVDYLRDYTDGPWRTPRMQRLWCHLTADSETELRAFAVRLGLRASWIQCAGDPYRVHFDIQPLSRDRAIALGAIEESDRERVARWSARRPPTAAYAASQYRLRAV